LECHTLSNTTNKFSLELCHIFAHRQTLIDALQIRPQGLLGEKIKDRYVVNGKLLKAITAEKFGEIIDNSNDGYFALLFFSLRHVCALLVLVTNHLINICIMKAIPIQSTY
jgi:hypothetical protein